MKTQDKPEEGKIYSLTGLGKSIANGNTWAESEVKEQLHKSAEDNDFNSFMEASGDECPSKYL